MWKQRIIGRLDRALQQPKQLTGLIGRTGAGALWDEGQGTGPCQGVVATRAFSAGASLRPVARTRGSKRQQRSRTRPEGVVEQREGVVVRVVRVVGARVVRQAVRVAQRRVQEALVVERGEELGRLQVLIGRRRRDGRRDLIHDSASANKEEEFKFQITFIFFYFSDLNLSGAGICENKIEFRMLSDEILF